MFSTQPIHSVKQPLLATVESNSLSGLVGYLKSQFEHVENLLVHVELPTVITFSSVLNEDSNRKEMIKANALLTSFQYDRFHDTEDFNSKLQSCFVKNEDRNIILQVVGYIREENVNTIGDDVVSQSVS